MKKEDILEHINELDILRKYINHDFTLGKAFISELREEKHPSANVFYGNRSRKYLYNDFAFKAIDAFGYVMIYYEVSFRDGLDIIASDFHLEDVKDYKRKPIKKIPKLPKPKFFDRTEFVYKSTNWDNDNTKFWWKTGISLSTLKVYNTIPIKWFHLKEHPNIVTHATKQKPIYLFQEGKGQKFYAPFHEKKSKFKNNMNPEKEVFGYSALNDHEPAIGIIGGNRDVLVMYEHLGIKCVSLNSESAFLMQWLYKDLMKKTPYLFIMYDNDKTGVLGMRKNADIYDIPIVHLSDILGYCTLKNSTWINDITDYAERVFVKRNVSSYHIKKHIYNAIKTYQNRKLQKVNRAQYTH